MSRVIWKFTVYPGVSDIGMPSGSTILSVGAQGEDVAVWAMVDPSKVTRAHRVAALMTGMEFETLALAVPQNFVGTVQRPDGIVVHVFDLGEA